MKTVSLLLAFLLSFHPTLAHPNYLGSTSVMTDAAGQVAQRTTYLPYGSVATDTGALTLPEKFTSKRLDAEVGLYDFGARAYDPAFSRFLTPDLADPSYSDPQTLNPYSYTRNNPVKLVDPTGEVYDTFLDAYFVSRDLEAFSAEPTFLNGAALGLDLVAAFIPTVPAIAGLALRGLTTGTREARVIESVSAQAQAAWEGELTGEIGRGLFTAQREAMAGGRQFQKGVLAAEGLEENQQLITTTIQTRTGLKSVTTRPDALTSAMLEEVKDVKHLSRTKQFRAEIQAAKESGRQFVLTVSEKVEHITDPLRKALRDADAILRQFDERTGEFIQRDINRFLR